ncbi:uncharacterized protein BBA_04342 [Beauveria bassiana ARSEF 2860]|uniref:DUF8035 domain-containing protein n=1 Tax=Beauveria bassiana (strain ARSEF 2860) TaxID=655819 RepID=J4KP92_BEAB2|nr:uncharacterized protein BBA_04342 [Beauveria bassiana ARSEF 2860]EJP67049.1 hypothetical protein BBA_04342 [Beauveria bassiana ARSEF 2860]
MTDRHRNQPPVSRSVSTNPSRSSLPASMAHQPPFLDESYTTPASSRYPITTALGHSSSTTSSGQPTTTRTYAVAQDSRSRPSARDHSYTRRSTMESTIRPPVIITTYQNDRSQNSMKYGTGVGNSSPVRDDYHQSSSQYYAVPGSTSRSRSSARPYQVEEHPRRRDRADSLLSAHNTESHRKSRPSATYPSNQRHSAASIDYGDDGYKYTNAGELVRYDLDHYKPSRPQNYDSFNHDKRPRASHAGNHRRSGSLRYEAGRGYTVPHGRSDAPSGPPPSTRGLDNIDRDYALGRVRQAHTATSKPPQSLAHSETPGILRVARETRYGRPVSVSQEPSYWSNSPHTRDDYRDWRSHVYDRSNDGAAENRRPHSTHFYDESISNRGFGIRTSPDAAPEGRRDGRRDDRRSRDEPRSHGFLHFGDKPLAGPRKVTQDRQSSVSEESKHSEGHRNDSGRETSYGVIGTAGTGLGISAAAAGLVASKRDNESARGVKEQKETTYGSEIGNSSRHETEVTGNSSPRGPIEATKDQHSLRPETMKVAMEGVSGPAVNGGASLVKYNPPSASDSDEAGRGSVRRKQRPLNSFNPNDTSDLRQIREQLAVLRLHETQKQSDEASAGGNERRARSPSPTRKAASIADLDQDDQSYAVGFPVEKKHARVVSPPRDRRDDKPLKGILKQPSASFPEEANPIREGVAPHKEDKKLKEVPPGARWTRINRRIVNPEALRVGQERFEERDDFVIVLRVLSKEEIQAYAAATQVLRERRRNRDNPDRDQERRHQHDDGSSQHYRRHRRQVEDSDRDSGAEAGGWGLDGNLDDADEGHKSARDEGSDSSSDKRRDAENDGGGTKGSRRNHQDGDEIGRGRQDKAHGDAVEGDTDYRRKTRRDEGDERE